MSPIPPSSLTPLSSGRGPALHALQGLGLMLLLGGSLGFGLTWLVLSGDPPAREIRLGPWRAWPVLASRDADAYSRAWLARSGQIPLEAGEGLALMAREDTDGRAFDGACRYAVGPLHPGSRLWTLAVEAPGSATTGTSSVSRAGDSLTVGPEGTALATPPGPFSLVLRLYGLPLAARRDLLERSNTALPGIARLGCR